MPYPPKNPKARICILRYPDEVTVCANVEGFRAMGEWMVWLAASSPTEAFHFHTLWDLASRSETERPENVWTLSQPEPPGATADVPDDNEVVPFELTFQMLTEDQLDELARCQHSGLVPERFRKEYPSVITPIE